MTSFKLATHAVTGCRMVEVYDGDEFIASIYPDARGIRVITKHPMSIDIDDSTAPAALNIAVAIGQLK